VLKDFSLSTSITMFHWHTCRCTLGGNRI